MPAKKNKTLTNRQKATLQRHSKHHTNKHMSMMKKLMRGGMTFTAAHKRAQKTVGTQLMAVVELPFKPGIVSTLDQTELTSEGRYVAGDKVRFRRVSDKSLPEVMKGFEDLFDHTIGGYLEGRVRALHVYQDLDGQNQLIAASEKAVYAFTGGLLWPITPIRNSSTATNAITTTDTSASVNITVTSHGCLVGDKVFLHNATPINNVDLGFDGAANNVITASAQSRSLIIELTAHGLVTGARLTISGASSVAGIPTSEINKTHTIYKVSADQVQIIVETKADADVVGGGGSITFEAMSGYAVDTVVDDNNFTITAPQTANGSATGGGTLTFEFEINSGRALSTKTAGYSTGTYSTGTYGTQSPEVDVNARVWTLDNFGEVALGNFADSGLFKWQNNPSQRMELVSTVATDCPTKIRTHCVTAERYILTLGTQSVSVGGTVNNDFNPLQITWAKAQEGLNNGDWTPSEANSAGSIILGGSASQIVAAANMPFVTLIWTQTELFSLQFIAGNIDVVFKPALLASGAGIISKNAWVRAGDSGSVFWLSSSREFMVWTGGATPTTITCPVKNLFFDKLSDGQESLIYGCGLDSENEITWYYPTDESGESENFRFITLNYAEGHWHTGTMAITACVQRGLEEFSIAAWAPEDSSTGTTLRLMEKGKTANGNAIPNVFLETGWIDAQEGDTFSRVIRYIPDWLTDSTINVKIYHKNFPQAQSFEIEDLGPINKATLKKDFRVTARQIKIRYDWSSSTTPTDGRLGRTLLDITPTRVTR